MAGPQAEEDIQVSIGKDGSRISRGDTVVDITPAGDVTVFTGGDVELKPVAAAPAQDEGARINISADFNTVAVYGVSVTLDKDHVQVAAAGMVKIRPAIVEAPPENEMKIGTRMEDGSVYAGVSPSTGQPMFAAPVDEKRRLFGWQLSTPAQAQKRAAKKSRETGQEYRVPTWAELKMLFNNRAAIGGFDESGGYPYSWYRSANPGLKEGVDRRQLFSTGAESSVYSDYSLSVRLVRS